VKSIQFHFLRGIQISDPLLMEINFSLQQGVIKRFLAEFHRNLEFQEIPVNFFEFQLPEVSLNFSLNLFRIWRNFYKESCSLSQDLSIHILFGIFGAW
jgi:hypothetical protein